MGGIGLSDCDLAFDPFKKGKDAFEGATEKDVVADAEEKLEVVEDVFGEDDLVDHLGALLTKSIDGLVEN